MFNFEDVDFSKVVIHNIGNKHNDEDLLLSKYPIELDDDIVKNILSQYFLTPFKKESYFNFFNETNLNENIIYKYASEIFENPESIYDVSVNISAHLYEQSNHPNIKSGEFYIIHFKNCIVDNEEVDCIGLFKSENKDIYLKIYCNEDNFELNCEDGINIKKLDKGCLIFNTEKESGYKVCIIDKTNAKGEAHFWKEDFLGLKPREDQFYHTNNYLNMCRGFVDEVYNSENEVPMTDQIDMLNKSVDFFNNTDNFNEESFKKEVIKDEDINQAFEEYKKYYEQQRDIDLDNNFKVSKDAVKDNKRFFKHVLKLDKNFHLYIHGDRKFIQKGYDSEREMNFYKVFFHNEE